MSLYIPNLATDDPAGFVQGLADNFGILAGSQIVEQGSNENGEYWRWENGLQICYNKLPPQTFVYSSTAKGMYRSDTKEFAYPAPFTSEPSGGFSGMLLFNGFEVATSVSSVGWAVMLYAFASWTTHSSATDRITLFAIGRWK